MSNTNEGQTLKYRTATSLFPYYLRTINPRLHSCLLLEQQGCRELRWMVQGADAVQGSDHGQLRCTSKQQRSLWKCHCLGLGPGFVGRGSHLARPNLNLTAPVGSQSNSSPPSCQA